MSQISGRETVIVLLSAEEERRVITLR
jgi:hypothetical protein